MSLKDVPVRARLWAPDRSLPRFFGRLLLFLSDSTLRLLPSTFGRRKRAEVSLKRAVLHPRATISAKSVALECRLGVARGRILERSKEHKWMVLLLSKTKTHTTVALYGENAAVVIGQGSGGAFQGI